MFFADMKINRIAVIVAVLALPLFTAAAPTAVPAGSPLPTGAPTAMACGNHPIQEEAPADEAEQERRLRRARAEHESRRAQTAHKLEVEQVRQREIARLRGAVSSLGQRESFLHHDAYWTQRELDSVSRDPADLSAMARRGHAGREIHDLRNQLDQATTARRGAMKQLDELRFR